MSSTPSNLNPQPLAGTPTPARGSSNLRTLADLLSAKHAAQDERNQENIQSRKAHRRLSIIAFGARLWRAINDKPMCPGYSLASIKGKILMTLKCMGCIRELWRWHILANDPKLASMVERHPLLPALPNRPYLNSAWSFEERRQSLQTHYAMLNGAASILDFSAGQSALLVSLDDVEPGLQLILDKPHWLADEGEVAMSLMVGDTRIYSLVFTLGEREGRRVAYVGAIQGKAGGNGLDIIRHLTRAAHGMRPRDLLFAAFRMFCTQARVEAILGIADASNICHDPYFKGSKFMYARHDPTWQEYGGLIRPDGFFEIASVVSYRQAQDVPARKRALYRRRYDMLHSMEKAITERLKLKNSQRAAHSPAKNALLYDLMTRMTTLTLGEVHIGFSSMV